MLQKFYKWKYVRRLNKHIIKNNSDIKYILVIPNTISFQLLNDLNRTFKRSFNMSQYIELLSKFKCYTIYLTLFTLKEKNRLGIIADDISKKIVLNSIQKFLKSLKLSVPIIGPSYLCSKFKVLSYDYLLRENT